jgi:hypothetical protein
MKALNLADVFYLRALNILFIYYGANRTLKAILPKETEKLTRKCSFCTSNFAYWCFY